MLKLRTLFVLMLVIGASSFAMGCVKGHVSSQQAPNETFITTNVLYDQYMGPARAGDGRAGLGGR